ncbi:LysE/ArgO family amino acid transporter [Phenylobacterium sp. LjRoot219]|uniref:LysE/ArgO family amino acid transporter n=1 Tax=Phenylobacterium sp. LjRoot219 TaxID=3342283 RepID=UPI003ED0B9B5
MLWIADPANMQTTTFLQGFAVSAPLIMAIGAQNIFVLRQGVLRQHVLPIVAFCSTMDALLIASGVGGLGAILGAAPALRLIMALAGAAFLIWYGVGAASRAANPGALDASGALDVSGLGSALARAAAFTLLNPHVYLDTVLLVGSIGAAHPRVDQPTFIAGAASASVLWFASLGFGARLLAPFLSKPEVWRGIEATVAIMMFFIAAKLLLGATQIMMG